MAGEVLHVTQRHARVQPDRDRRMPQSMRDEMHRDLSVTSERSHEVLHVVGRHPPSSLVDQQRAAVPTVDREGDCLHGGRRERDHGSPIALGGGQLQGGCQEWLPRSSTLQAISSPHRSPLTEQHRGPPPRPATVLDTDELCR
jgi:hypothetical protein